MKKETKSNVPVWYWIIAGIALLWNLMGCAAFAMELFAQEAMMESWTDEQKEWAESIPVWVYIIYAIAVSSGLAGSVGLLLRQVWSAIAFAICLVSVVIQMGYSMLIAGGFEIMGPSSIVMPTLVVVLAGTFLWFSWFAKTKGLIGASTQS